MSNFKLFGLTFLIIAVASCDDPKKKTADPRGHLGEQCLTDGTCFDALDCTEDLCVEHVIVCGDGRKESPEECDGADLGGLGCTDLGGTSGTAGCTAQCAYNLSGCMFAAPATRIRKPRIANGVSGLTTCMVANDGQVGCWGGNGYKTAGRDLDRFSDEWRPGLGNHVFTKMAFSIYHGCGLSDEGIVYCFGYAEEGAVGEVDDKMIITWNQEVPKQVSGLPTDIVDLCAAFIRIDNFMTPTHSCALTAGGAVWCWGSPDYRVLGVDDGLNPVENRPLPVQVPGNHVFTQIACGGIHNCALDEVGNAWCWGSNFLGQLGQELDLTHSAAPVEVSGGHLFERLFAGQGGNMNFPDFSGSGQGHTCGLKADGSAWCWGVNTTEQLGVDQLIPYSTTPLTVAGDHVFLELAIGSVSTCGLDDEGQVLCWGKATMGSEEISRALPTAVDGNHTFSNVRAFGNNYCARDTDNVLWCWGEATLPNQSIIPVQYHLEPASGNFVLGSMMICQHPEQEAFSCTGNNDRGRSGRFQYLNLPFLNPVEHEDPMNIVGVADSISWSLSDTKLLAWGRGQTLGFNDITGEQHQHIPLQFDMPEKMVQYSEAGLLLSETGKLYYISLTVSWVEKRKDGPFIELRHNLVLSESGELFEISFKPLTLTRVHPGETFRTIPVFPCAINTQGRAECLCLNKWEPIEEQEYWYQDMSAEYDFVRIECGKPFCYGLTSDKQMFRWNRAGCEIEPVELPGELADFTVGEDCRCFLLTDNRVFCEGTGWCLGNGTYHDRTTPVQVISESEYLHLWNLE